MVVASGVLGPVALIQVSRCSGELRTAATLAWDNGNRPPTSNSEAVLRATLEDEAVRRAGTYVAYTGDPADREQ